METKTNTKKTTKTTGTKADEIQPKEYAVKMTEAEMQKVITLADAIVDSETSYKDQVRKLYCKGVTHAQIVELHDARSLKPEKLAKVKAATSSVRTALFKGERDAILKAAKKSTDNKALTLKELFGKEEEQEHDTRAGKERIRNGGELVIMAVNDLAGIDREEATSFGCALEDNPSLVNLLTEIVNFSHNGESLAHLWENDGMSYPARLDALKQFLRGIDNQLNGALADDWKAAKEAVSQADKNEREEAKKAKAEEKAKAEAEAEAIRNDRMKENFQTILKGNKALEFVASDLGKTKLPATIKPAGMKKLITAQRQKVALLTESVPTKKGKALWKAVNAHRSANKLVEYVTPSWQLKS